MARKSNKKESSLLKPKKYILKSTKIHCCHNMHHCYFEHIPNCYAPIISGYVPEGIPCYVTNDLPVAGQGFFSKD